MSDKLKNFILGGGMALIWVMTLGFLDWRSSVHADNALKAAGLVSPALVEANTESIKDLEKNHDKLDGKIERIVDILLE